ncbi:MAG TPA: hypothetical protein VNZ22_07470 [Bacillota bacterium]|nr:hypothetical protein [Bacillota bacterium]
MKELFEAIRITDLDIDLTQPSQEESGLRHLYLRLSAAPPREWVKIFEQKRRFPRRSRWRNAWVAGAHIVIDCIPEELEQFALNHLQEDGAQTNQSFVKWAPRNDAAIVRQLKEKAAVRAELKFE